MFPSSMLAAESGDAWAKQGMLRYHKEQFEDARHWFEKAEAENHPDALFYLGEMSARGQGGFKKDAQKAEYYYRRAAKQDHEKAQLALGVTLTLKAATSQSRSFMQKTFYHEARKWLDSASRKGNAEAMFWYGELVMKGLGGSIPDAATGLVLLRESAAMGNANGQAMLGAYEWKGKGLPRDLASAYRWMALAEKHGNENARLLKMQISAQMNEEQLVKAKELIASWKPQRFQPSHLSVLGSPLFTPEESKPSSPAQSPTP